MRFVIAETDTGLAPLHKEKARTSRVVANAVSAGFVTFEPADSEADSDWAFVSLDAAAGSAPTHKGWIETKNLAKLDSAGTERFSLFEDQFVQTCARMELPANAPGGMELTAEAPGGTAEATVVADFLLAWANLESAVTSPAPADYSNCLPDFDSSDAEGPFRLTSADWELFRADVNEPGESEIVPEVSRLIPACQVPGAAFLALKYSRDYSRLATPNPQPADGPQIASYLNVLHCHWLGAAAAFHFQQLMDAGNGAEKSDSALRVSGLSDSAVASLMKNRAAFLTRAGAPSTVAKFFESTDAALSGAFKTAYRSILKHADFLLPPEDTITGPAPWLAVAEAERQEWVSNNLRDSTGAGLQKVIAYLKTVGYVTAVRDAWCGGFVGHCFKNSSPSFESSIVRGGAQAKNWVGWGNARLRIHHLRDIPVGALVVTVPLEEGTTGHVAFFSRKVPGTEEIELFGGNQSRTVSNTMRLHKNKIREIRWLDTVDPTPSDNDPAPVPGSPVGANKGEVLVLARTIYGEARSETRKGMEAVADVVMNRVRRKFFGKSVEGVCRFPEQFSCWNRTDPNFRIIRDKKPSLGDRVFDMCFEIAGHAVQQTAPLHVTPATLHYHAASIAKPSWVRNSPSPPLKVTLREGGHIFYSGVA